MTRFFCVTCQEENGKVFMSVQSNNIPSYCANTSWSANQPVDKVYDVKLSWNLGVSAITERTMRHWQVNTSNEVTDALCYTTSTSFDKVPAAIDMEVFGTGYGPTYVPDTLLGWSLDGIPFVQNLSKTNQDMLYPLEIGGSSRPDELTLSFAQDMDTCSTTLGWYADSTQPDGYNYFLAYNMLPTCLYTFDQVSVNFDAKPLCSETASCASDPLSYGRVAGGYTTNFKGLRIIGIAKDGHVIYGPYNQDEELWDCDDHDICNGRYFSEMDGSYAYVATATHPYILGCFGPAPEQLYF